MTIARSAGEVLADHVTLEVESIDRLYLNLYVPILQSERGVAYFWRQHRGYQFASSALMAPMSRKFVAKIERFARDLTCDPVTRKSPDGMKHALAGEKYGCNCYCCVNCRGPVGDEIRKTRDNHAPCLGVDRVHEQPSPKPRCAFNARARLHPQVGDFPREENDVSC